MQKELLLNINFPTLEYLAFSEMERCLEKYPISKISPDESHLPISSCNILNQGNGRFYILNEERRDLYFIKIFDVKLYNSLLLYSNYNHLTYSFYHSVLSSLTNKILTHYSKIKMVAEGSRLDRAKKLLRTYHYLENNEEVNEGIGKLFFVNFQNSIAQTLLDIHNSKFIDIYKQKLQEFPDYFTTLKFGKVNELEKIILEESKRAESQYISEIPSLITVYYCRRRLIDFNPQMVEIIYNALECVPFQCIRTVTKSFMNSHKYDITDKKEIELLASSQKLLKWDIEQEVDVTSWAFDELQKITQELNEKIANETIAYRMELINQLSLKNGVH